MGAVKTGCPVLFLLRLLCQFVVSVASSGRHTFSVAFDPPFVHSLVTGQNVTARVTVNYDLGNQGSVIPNNVFARSLDDGIASVVEGKQELISKGLVVNTNIHQFQANLTVRGNLLGKTRICVKLSTADDMLDSYDTYFKELLPTCVTSDKETLDVWVVQEKGRIVNHVFLTTLVLLIVIANVLMGCELDLGMVMETVRKPIPPLVGFCTQFIAMPLLAYGIAKIVFLNHGLDSFALGLFVNGCAPGGGASNYWTLLLDGDLPVSITMTFISTLAALVMMPLWIWALGSHFLRGYYSGVHIKMPYGKIITSLFTMIVPLLIGIALSKWKPAIRTKARKVMRPFLIFVLLFLIGFGAIANLYMFKIMTWTAVLGGLLLPWCGFTIGCFASLFTRQKPEVVTAIAIETGIQNTGIAIMMLKFSFPEPDSDISSLIPVISACFTPLPLLFMVGAHEVVKCIKKRHQQNLPDLEAKEKPKFVDLKASSIVDQGNGKDRDSFAEKLSFIET